MRMALHHRTGRLDIGEASVAIVTASPHRGDAFAACRYVIERVKQIVPVWKREWGENGPYWVGWQDARCDAHVISLDPHSSQVAQLPHDSRIEAWTDFGNGPVRGNDGPSGGAGMARKCHHPGQLRGRWVSSSSR